MQVSNKHETFRSRGHNTKGNVAHLAFACRLDARHSLQLQRRVVTEKHLRGVLQSHPTFPGVDEFLVVKLATG